MPPNVELLTPRARVEGSTVSAGAVLSIDDDRGPMQFLVHVCDGRLVLGVLLAHHERPIDVSADPAVLLEAVSPSGRDDDVVAVSGWLQRFAVRRGVFASPPPDLRRGITGGAFPLLGHLYDEGAATLPAVPRWAVAPLRERTARDAARAALGVSATRVVVAALAASLSSGHAGRAPNLYPLALALMGGGVLAPDGIARVLGAAAAGPAVPHEDLPTVDDIQLVRSVAGWVGARRLERLLTDAARRREGHRQLVTTMRLLIGLPAGVWTGLPSGLEALHARCVELTPVNPRPRPVLPWPTPRTPSRANPQLRWRAPSQHRREMEVPRSALRAPASGGAAPAPDQAFRYPKTVAAMHRRALDPNLRLVLPRTPLELHTWGHLLHSCVGSFSSAVEAGSSVLIGVERHDVLRYCVELTPYGRTIRQFHASHNRAVPRPAAALVVRALLAGGLLEADHPKNRPWIALCEGDH